MTKRNSKSKTTQEDVETKTKIFEQVVQDILQIQEERQEKIINTLKKIKNEIESRNLESEESQLKIEQVKEETILPTAIILQTDKNSLLEKKFSELTFDKKREYLYTVFGTVRGCTGFFDTRFTAGMSDYKTFDIGEGNMADVIIKNSGTYSDAGGGSESDNSIMIVFQGKKYGGGGVRFYETNEIDRPRLQYVKIIDCKKGETENEFTVTVKCKDESIKKISVNGGTHYEFEEDLIGKLRVPKELLQKEEEIKKLLQEEISKEEKELAEQNMYQRAIDMFILEDNRKDVQKYINKPGVKLSEDQKKSYIEYLLNGRKQHHGQGLRREDTKDLLVLLKTFEDQNYVKSMCEEIIEKSISWENGEAENLVQSTIQLGGLDANTQYTKRLEYKIKYIIGWGEFKSLDLLIKRYNQDEKVRYQKILEKVYESNFITGYREEYIEKVVSTLAQKLGKSVDGLFKDIFVKNIKNIEYIGYSSLKSVFSIMESKGYEKELYIEIFDKVCNNKNLREDRSSNECIEIIDMICKIKSQINKKLPQDFFINIIQIYANKDRKLPYHDIRNKYIIDYSIVEKDEILEKLSDKYITSYANFMCDDLVNRGLKDKNKIVGIIEYMFGERHAFKKTESFVKVLKENNLIDVDLEKNINDLYVKISNEYLSGKEIDSNRRCNEELEEYSIYAQKELVEEYIEKKIKEYLSHTDNRDRSIYFSHVTNCLVNAGFDQQYFQNKIMTYIKFGQHDMAAKWIKGLGLHIDKIRVNTLIENLFQEGKVEEAEKLSRGGGLYDLRKNKILSRKLENKKLDSRDAKRSIEELKLDKSYYKYVIDIHINKGELKDALELAEKNDLLISQEQFDRYLGRDERLRKADQERKIREHQERQKLATEMMKYLSEGKISCNIDYTQDQKYVLIRDKQDGLKVASKNLEWHKNIVADINAKNEDVVGGGRISIDEEQKVVKIYGRSGDFGKVDSEYNEILKIILKVQYPDHTIIIE